MAALRPGTCIVNADQVFAEVAHDLRGVLGSMRLVITSAIDEDDPGQRRTLLQLADDEAKRGAAGLAALPALALAFTGDDADPTAVDLPPALAAAAAAAGRYGATVNIVTSRPAQVTCRPDVLALALPALFLLAAGLDGATDVSAMPTELGRVEIVCRGGALWPQGRKLAGRLVGALDGTIIDTDTGIRFTLPAAEGR